MLAHKRSLKVFLCYAHADRQPVEALYARLVQDGVDVWLDKKKLLPGQDWELEIRRAVREADVVVVCLSRRFQQMGFRQKEVRWTLDTAMQQPEGEIFIVPLRLENCDTLESLRKWHWVNLFSEDGYEKLVRALSARANSIGITLQRNVDKLPWGKLRNNPIAEFIQAVLALTVIIVVIFSAAWIAKNSRTKPIYVTSDVSGKREIYRLNKQRDLERVTITPAQYESWSPAPDRNGNLYFVSDRDGKPEIYELTRDGQTVRITLTVGEAKSWSPAPDGNGNLYFVSNRGGEVDIYELTAKGDVKAITTTLESANNWSPAPDGNGNLYFVSDRGGEVDIYMLTSAQETKRVITMPGLANSWSPAPDGHGNLYFVSDRDAETDIYVLTPSHQTVRVTISPGSANSWAPVPDSTGKLYFTSDRTGKIESFVLTQGQVDRVSNNGGQSWTGTINAKDMERDSK